MAGDAALRRTDNGFNFEKDIENMAKGRLHENEHLDVL